MLPSGMHRQNVVATLNGLIYLLPLLPPLSSSMALTFLPVFSNQSKFLELVRAKWSALPLGVAGRT